MTLTAAPPLTFLATSDFNIDRSPLPTELTVAQAAQILDMPEGAILEMFKLGILECRQEGTQRLTDRDKLFAYKRNRDIGYAWLDEMALEDREMGLY